jgi:hypothetical protein
MNFETDSKWTHYRALNSPAIRIASVFVGNIFDEKQNENVILVLGSIHAPAKLVAALPKRAVYFGFLDGHKE